MQLTTALLFIAAKKNYNQFHSRSGMALTTGLFFGKIARCPRTACFTVRHRLYEISV